MSAVGKNFQAFKIAINSHDRENPTHTATGIGLAYFDMDRLGFDEAEELWPGITIHGDKGVTGNFRVICDGDHNNGITEQVKVTRAVGVEA
jgi:hypothetical protein